MARLPRRGAITLFAGRPKLGKSTFSFGVVGAVASETSSFLGREIDGGPVVYLSEEGSATLGHKLPAVEGVRVLTRDAAWPKPEWPALVASAVAEAERVGAALIVIDTFSFWAALPAEREKDAGAVQAAIEPLIQAARAGFASCSCTTSARAEARTARPSAEVPRSPARWTSSSSSSAPMPTLRRARGLCSPSVAIGEHRARSCSTTTPPQARGA